MILREESVVEMSLSKTVFVFHFVIFVIGIMHILDERHLGVFKIDVTSTASGQELVGRNDRAERVSQRFNYSRLVCLASANKKYP